ncbi:Molybdopterin binding protein [Meredithblackwellia eburnea MCA 4105]
MDDLPKFPLSPVPKDTPVIKNAAVLIIGDEVLNGKTKDSNSNFAAKMFFDLGVDLKRIEVIADDEAEIVEAVTRMAKNYDIVITSGGIGPTHDDITYDSIAAAFKQSLKYDDETIKRMNALSKRRYNLGEQTEEQKTARLRMALFPDQAEVLFVKEELWVPVVRVEKKVCILPGVPTLFQQLLTGLCARFVELPPASSKPFRLLIHTELPESSIAPFLTKLQERVKKELVRVGSYPKLNQGVDVSLIGQDLDRLKELSSEGEIFNQLL